MELADKIETLAAKATPEPWGAIKGIEEGDETRCGVVATRGKLSYLIATIENGAPGDWCDTEFVNAELIALLRNNLPTILAALRTV